MFKTYRVTLVLKLSPTKPGNDPCNWNWKRLLNLSKAESVNVVDCEEQTTALDELKKTRELLDRLIKEQEDTEK